jgi:hypothetical protein
MIKHTPRPKITPEERQAQQFLITHVHDTALHILHNSYLYGSDLWPKNGFVTGQGMDCKIKWCINIGVNPYGWANETIEGRLAFTVYNTGMGKKIQQEKHLRIIMDQAYQNDLYFENEFKNTVITDYNWFKFTYTPTQLNQ